MSKRFLLTRRSALWLGLASLAGMGALVKGRDKFDNYQVQALDNPKRDFKVVGKTSLKERAAVKRLIYGGSSVYHELSLDPEFAACFVQQCGILVPGLELKWSSPYKPLRPSPDKFDFTAGDWMAKFAKTHGLLFQGTTLVWHDALPSWFKDTVNPQNAEQFLIKHIKTVVEHYAGQMHSWVVVNEAIEPTDERSDGLRKTPWLEFLGPDYIDLAFRVAAKADPKALLLYNDYGLEYDNGKDEAKRTALLKLLEHLKARGTPIHALGLQAHLWGNETRFNPKKLRDFLSNVASLGLKILITEMDVIDKKSPSDVPVRDRIVARAYEDYLSVVLDEPAVIAVLTWGLSDRYTWLSEFQPRGDGAPVRPLPFNAQLQRKLAWNAIARAFDKAPMHHF